MMRGLSFARNQAAATTRTSKVLILAGMRRSRRERLSLSIPQGRSGARGGSQLFWLRRRPLQRSIQKEGHRTRAPRELQDISMSCDHASRVTVSSTNTAL